MNVAVIIVAGGSGRRMGGELPKQFLLLAGRPVLMRTMQQFADYPIVLAMNADYIDYWHRLCEQHNFRLPHTVVAGGAERYHSVSNALGRISADVDIVAVHDAVRPLVDGDTIRRCIAGAAAHHIAVPVVPFTDSVRHIDDAAGTTHAVPRSRLCAVQTPQCFDAALLRAAYSCLDYEPGFTDDATVVENYCRHTGCGYTVHTVAGNPENIKITTPIDMAVARAVLAGREDRSV